jgi:Uncharacterized protein related to the periplasmic component of the Tol biopolymer transport system
MKRHAVSRLTLGIHLLALLGLSFIPIAVDAQNGHGAGQTRLLRTPTVSANQIGFAYANNIWVAPRSGGSARRLTSFQGQTANPHFSPDGKWIAFSGEYSGNFDVYVVAADGGEPKRLTWHPGADMVEGLDRRWQRNHVLLNSRDLGAKRRTEILDGVSRRRRGRTYVIAARIPGKDFS